MPAIPLFPTKEVRRQKFAYFLNPSELPQETQTWIVETVSSSANGLNITKADVLKDLETQNTSAYAFVWNSPASWAFGCLQYYDWLERGVPQLWITDVCRVQTCLADRVEGSKDPTKPSPVRNLLLLLQTITRTYGISDVWLMVDDTESANKLQTVYEGYGFVREGYYNPLNVWIMRRKN